MHPATWTGIWYVQVTVVIIINMFTNMAANSAQLQPAQLLHLSNSHVMCTPLVPLFVLPLHYARAPVRVQPSVPAILHFACAGGSILQCSLDCQ